MIKLRDLISTKIYDPFTGELSEGLIQTVEVPKAANIVRNQFNTLDSLTVVEKENTIIVGFRPKYLDQKIQNYLGSYPDKSISEVLVLLNNLGYSPSAIQYKVGESKEYSKIRYTPSLLRNLVKEEEPSQLLIVFEAKFDQTITPPDTLYHITNLSFVDSIKSIGLKPKTLSKRSTHTERIYFSLNRSSSDFLWINLKYNIPKGKGVLLTIDTKGLSNTFYNDPNFNGQGVYTYENIPPQNIIKYEPVIE